MAEEGYFRLWNPEWCNSSTDDCIRTNVRGKRNMVFEIAVTEASSAVAELGSAADNPLDGTTTPVILYVASTDALDRDAAAGCTRAIHIIGISVASSDDYVLGLEEPKFSVEEVRMDSADGTTDVTTERYYLRVMHAYATEWGTGDAGSHETEGAISVANDAVPTITYLTMDAASNESNSSGKIYLVDDYYGRWTRCYISLHDEDINEA